MNMPVNSLNDTLVSQKSQVPSQYSMPQNKNNVIEKTNNLAYNINEGDKYGKKYEKIGFGGIFRGQSVVVSDAERRQDNQTSESRYRRFEQDIKTKQNTTITN